MGSLFGGQKSKSTSKNQAYGTINNWASPLLGYAKEGALGLSSLLGGDTTGLDKFKSSMGYDWELGQGQNSIAAKALSQGLGDSGATLKGLAKYQTGLNNSYAQNYINQLLGLSNIGATAAGTLTNAGQTSTSTQSGGGGIGGILGGLASNAALFSDKRLKKDIQKIGELEDGLGIYEYSYIWEDRRQKGVMADEVAQLRPWALGPRIDGFMTVNYGRL